MVQHNSMGRRNIFHTRQANSCKCVFVCSPLHLGAGIAILGGSEWIEGGAFRIRDRDGIG